MAYKQKSECWINPHHEKVYRITQNNNIDKKEENVNNWRDHVSHNFFDNDQKSNKQLESIFPTLMWRCF